MSTYQQLKSSITHNQADNEQNHPESFHLNHYDTDYITLASVSAQGIAA